MTNFYLVCCMVWCVVCIGSPLTAKKVAKTTLKYFASIFYIYQTKIFLAFLCGC